MASEVVMTFSDYCAPTRALMQRAALRGPLTEPNR